MFLACMHSNLKTLIQGLGVGSKCLVVEYSEKKLWSCTYSGYRGQFGKVSEFWFFGVGRLVLLAKSEFL